MTLSRLTALALAASLLLAVSPMKAHAATGSCPTQKKHSLPKAGNGLNIVFSFGTSGGNIRPWNVSIALDGTVHASGVPASVSQVPDARNTLKALLALADAQKFFSMKGQISCSNPLPNPDSGSHNIAVTTSSGTKRVSAFGTCNGKFEGLYDLLTSAVGVGR